MKKKKIIIISIIVLVIIAIGVGIIVINNNKKKDEVVEEEPVVRVTGKAVEDRETKEYKLCDIKMTAKKQETEVVITVKNISGKETKARDVYIKYVDDQSNEIGKTRIPLPKMKKDQEITLSTIITQDLKNAKDYKIDY